MISDNGQYNVHFADDPDSNTVDQNSITYPGAGNLSLNVNLSSYTGSGNAISSNCANITTPRGDDEPDGSGIDEDVNSTNGFTDSGNQTAVDTITNPLYGDRPNRNYLFVYTNSCAGKGPGIAPGPGL